MVSLYLFTTRKEMTFRFIYEPMYYPQLVFACLVDSRQSNQALANKIGSVIKEQVDLEVSRVTDSVLPYRVETSEGVLAAYMSLLVGNMGQSCVAYQLVVRTNFHNFTTDIQTAVTKFINENGWRPDFLT